MKKLTILSLLLQPVTIFAQNTEIIQPSRKWFLPDHVKLQFAGGLGYLSGGPGYVSRNKTLETDLLLGYLPQKIGGDALLTTSLKTTYSPWKIRLKNDYYIRPISTGMYLSYTFGPQFDLKWPNYYPKGYYWWATAFRPGAYIGGKVGKEKMVRNKYRNFEFYYEVGTYDLLLISYVLNPNYLRLSDVVNLALGIKVGF